MSLSDRTGQIFMYVDLGIVMLVLGLDKEISTKNTIYHRVLYLDHFREHLVNTVESWEEDLQCNWVSPQYHWIRIA